MMKTYTFSLVIFFLFSFFYAAVAQYGYIDSSYANNGKQNYPDFNPYLFYDKGLTIIEQTDNSFILLGDILKTDENDQMFLPVWKFVNDLKSEEILGKISNTKETFLIKCASPFGSRYTNKFLVGGSRNQDLFIRKFDAEGEPDFNFGHLGEVIMDLGGNDVVRSMTLLSNGNYIVIIKTGDKLAVRKLKSDGSWDNIFGNNGQVDIPVFGDFKICAAINSNDDVFFNTGPDQICKMSKAGIIDAGYNATANLYLDLTTSHLLPLDDGSLIVSGNELVTQQSMIMYKLKADGSQDNSFGSFGKTVVRYNGKYNSINKVELFGSRLYVAGDIDQDFFIGQFSDNGIAVPSFGVNGQTIIEFGSSLSYGLDMRITNNGKALIAGMRQDWLGLARVILSENPVISAHASVTEVCRGESFQLFSEGGVTYHWTGNDGFESFDANPVLMIPDTFPGSTVTYRVKGSNADGFSSEAIVVVDIKPVISVTYDEKLPCFGTSTGHQVRIFKNQFYDANTLVLFDQTAASVIAEDNTSLTIEFGSAGSPLLISFNDTLERYCTSEISVTFETHPEIKAGLETTSIDSTCISVVTPLSENDPLEFLWSNGATTKIASGLPSGPFSVTITNLTTGCTESFEAECEPVLASNDLKLDEKNIFPNPVSTSLNILWDGSSDPVVVKLFDVRGNEIMVNITQNVKLLNLDVSALSQGIYFLRILEKNGNSNTGKFIKI